ncbi:MAG: hypothetical protein JSU00_24840 [Acidobacteria bacterium]|nr:hypothetical protein [Acidobacteriota bacterium]
MPQEIQALTLFEVREPKSGRILQLLKATTREGLTGWGEARGAVAADLADASRHWQGKPATAYGTIPPGPLSGALDTAFLDIVGKAAKAPVYRLLGGPTRNKARAFASISDEEAIAAARAAGHKALAIRLPAPKARNQGQPYTAAVQSLANSVRATEADFILSANSRLTPGDAARLATELERLHPLWFDEPCPIANQQTIRKIAEESVLPLGFGRDIQNPAIFQDLLRQSLIDIARPDIVHFGVTGCRRIAALAETYYVAVAPNHEAGPIATAAALQLAASLPNFFIQHIPLPTAPEDRAMRAEIAGPIETVKDGFCALPDGPGLGVQVNEQALEKYRAS